MVRKNKVYSDPSVNFMDTMWKESAKYTGLHLKVERIPQGSMANHLLNYIPVNLIDREKAIESQLKNWFGKGHYALTIVAVERRPLESVRSLWVHIGIDNMQSRTEIRKNRAEIRFIKAVTELSMEKQEEETGQIMDIVKIYQDANQVLSQELNDMMLNGIKIANDLSSNLLTAAVREKKRRDGIKDLAKLMAGLFLIEKKHQAEVADKKKKELKEIKDEIQKLIQS